MSMVARRAIDDPGLESRVLQQQQLRAVLAEIKAQGGAGRCIYALHPLRPELRNEVALHEPQSIASLAPDIPHAFLCNLNGDWLLRADWQRLTEPGDTVLFVAAPPLGGGGGDSNPLQTVLAIALIAVGAYVSTVNPALGGALISSGVGLLAGQVLGLLTPVPRAPGGLDAGIGTSPTYNVQLAGNSARLGQAIPVGYGRVRTYPDYGSTPYNDYDSDDQFFNAYLVVGQGQYQIEQVGIEDTPISSFDDVQINILEPGQSPTFVDPFMITSPEVAGADMPTGQPVGGFVVCGATQTISRIYFDVYLAALYEAGDTDTLLNKSVTWKMEVRQLSEFGYALGNWIALATETITAAVSSPIRRSYGYDVAAGRYEARVTRTSARDNRARTANDILWTGLRAHLVSAALPPSTFTAIELRIRANGQLSGASSRRVTALWTRKLPIYNGSSWSPPMPTRSVVWAVADAARNTVYGAGLPDSRINLVEALALDAKLASRFDTFNAVFDTTNTRLDAFNMIARAGRSTALLVGGVLTLIRDEAKTLEVAAFTPRNIIAGSFVMDWSQPDEETADAVTVEYVDERSWLPRPITEVVPGAPGTRPERVQLFGVTNETQARREALHLAAVMAYRRRLPSWQTEMDGLAVQFGSLARLSHDLPRWGQSAEVESWDADSRTLLLTEPMIFSGNDYIALTDPQGVPRGPYVATRGGADDEVVLGSDPAFTPCTEGDKERTRILFGPGSDYGQRVRIVAVRPVDETHVNLAAVVEDDRVHSADNALLPVPPGEGENEVVVTFSEPRFEVDMAAVFGYPTQPGTYRLVLLEGAALGSNTVGKPAFDTGVWPAGCNLILDVRLGATVLGLGGDGGVGGSREVEYLDS